MRMQVWQKKNEKKKKRAFQLLTEKSLKAETTKMSRNSCAWDRWLHSFLVIRRGGTKLNHQRAANPQLPAGDSPRGTITPQKKHFFFKVTFKKPQIFKIPCKNLDVLLLFFNYPQNTAIQRLARAEALGPTYLGGLAGGSCRRGRRL